MILIDANVLLYAYDRSSPHHSRARSWMEGLLSTAELFGISWLTITAFIRISTSPRAFDNPLSVEEAVKTVGELLAHPRVVVLTPGEGHWGIFSKFLIEGQANGPLAMDAHQAALAVEHGAVLCTSDRDFSRFPVLKVVNPMSAEPRP